MLERLDYLKIAPRRIVDAGSGLGRDAAGLSKRYPRAQVIAADFSLPMLQRSRRRFFDKRAFVCADFARLPFAAASVDFIWSNMALHWAEAASVIGEFARVLAPEGLLMFATLGPDTLKELREAAGAARVHAFADMHDLGDLLVAAGFAAPVMEMEVLTFTYPDSRALLEDLRASGQTNARRDRPRGLAGRRFLTQVMSSLPPRATFEVVYGHAWRGAPRKLADGREVVQFRSPRAR